jgi:hypothetical protein
MSVNYVMEEDVLRVIFQGRRDLQQDIADLTEVVGADEFIDGMNLLLDTTSCEANPTYEEIIEFASFLGSLRPRIGRRCSVLVSSRVQYGLARMLAAHAEQYDLAISVFTAGEAALLWLDSSGDPCSIADRGLKERDPTD